MKRFLSLMIIAMLLVGCLSTAAFAEGERTATISFTIGGAEFSSFGGTISVSAPATITGIGGGVVGGPTGRVAFANMASNVSGVSVTVNVSVPANYCGSISASFSQEEAKQMQFDENGVFTGSYNNVSLSGGGSTTFAHAYGEWTETPGANCVTAGTKTATCSICGHVATEAGPVGDHVYKTVWAFDADNHWHECEYCNAVADTEAHTWGNWVTDKEPTYTEVGQQHCDCTKCGATKTEEIPKKVKPVNPDLPVPPMGDVTPYGMYNAMVATLIVMFGVAMLVIKRKSVK